MKKILLTLAIFGSMQASLLKDTKVLSDITWDEQKNDVPVIYTAGELSNLFGCERCLVTFNKSTYRLSDCFVVEKIIITQTQDIYTLKLENEKGVNSEVSVSFGTKFINQFNSNVVINVESIKPLDFISGITLDGKFCNFQVKDIIHKKLKNPVNAYNFKSDKYLFNYYFICDSNNNFIIVFSFLLNN